MADPVISEIKYLGGGTLDFLEVRVPDDYPDPGNLRLVIYDRNHNGSTTASPAASDIYDVTADGLLYTEDTDNDGNDDDGVLHYTFGTSENGTTIFLHAQDAVGLYNVVTGETYGLYNWSGAPYTVSTASGDPFAGQTATLLDNTGQVTGLTSLERQDDGTYTVAQPPVPGSSYICFTKGTQILTVNGEQPVESLSVGDTVVTKDLGARKILWIGQATFNGSEALPENLRPITIKAHAFGPNVPSRDTDLSPNHAVLQDHWKAALHFGQREVLTVAKSLVVSDVAVWRNVASVTYFHILLESHSLIQANGMWSESLFLGDQSMEMLTPGSRSEIFDQIPQIGGGLEGYGPKARYQLKPREYSLLV